MNAYSNELYTDLILSILTYNLGTVGPLTCSPDAVTGRGISSRHDGRGHQHSVAGIAVFSAVVIFGPLHPDPGIPESNWWALIVIVLLRFPLLAPPTIDSFGASFANTY